MINLSLFFMFLTTLEIKPNVLAIDLLNMDLAIGNALGISEFIGGMILTLVILFAVISLPIYKRQTTAIVFLGAMVLFISVALAWISVFVLFIIVGLIAFGIVRTANDFLREHGGFR